MFDIKCLYSISLLHNYLLQNQYIKDTGIKVNFNNIQCCTFSYVYMTYCMYAVHILWKCMQHLYACLASDLRTLRYSTVKDLELTITKTNFRSKTSGLVCGLKRVVLQACSWIYLRFSTYNVKKWNFTAF